MTAEITCEAVAVSHAYRKTNALSDVSFTLEAGHVTGLVGANGSGKSTLLRILSGVQRPDRGKIIQFGVDLASTEAAVTGVGAAVDGMAVWPNWSVQRTLTYAAGISGTDESRIAESMRDAQIAASARKRVRSLSLGNRQRMSLAIAILTGSRLVLLDEPMNGLDPEARQHTRDLIIRLAAEGRTVLLSSHDLHEVESLASSLLVLRQGVLAYQGATGEFRATTTMTLLVVDGDGVAAHGALAQAGLHCRRESNGELVVFAHDAPAALALLHSAKLQARAVAERPATLEERFHGAL